MRKRQHHVRRRRRTAPDRFGVGPGGLVEVAHLPVDVAELGPHRDHVRALGDDEHVALPDATQSEAFAAQRGDEHARAAVRFDTPRRPGVVEQRMLARPHEHAEALTDVEGRDPCFARRRCRRRGHESRRHQGEPCRAPRNAARRKQPRRASERRNHCPERRHVLLPQRPGQRGAPLEELEQPLHEPGAEMQQRVHRHDGGDERERRDHHRDERNRHGIGERSGD